MVARFDFYEVVRVNSNSTNLAPIVGEEGAILGKSKDEAEKWSYAVHIYATAETWHIKECELEATGNMDRRESFYDESSERVIVDHRTGEGHMIDDRNSEQQNES